MIDGGEKKMNADELINYINKKSEDATELHD